MLLQKINGAFCFKALSVLTIHHLHRLNYDLVSDPVSFPYRSDHSYYRLGLKVVANSGDQVFGLPETPRHGFTLYSQDRHLNMPSEVCIARLFMSLGVIHPLSDYDEGCLT